MHEPHEFKDLFRALNEWARADGHGLRAGGGRGGFSDIQFHTRPDPRGPEVQITLRAEIVDGQPRIVVSYTPPRQATPPAAERPNRAAGSSTIIVATPDDAVSRGRGRDPDAQCEACGVKGTIGRAARMDATGAVVEMHQFCFDCWPEQSARYQARWDEERQRRRNAFHRGGAQDAGPSFGTMFQAATWHAALELVRRIERSMIAPIPPSPDDAAQIAKQIRAEAPGLEGEMPFEVEAFLRRHESA